MNSRAKSPDDLAWGRCWWQRSVHNYKGAQRAGMSGQPANKLVSLQPGVSFQHFPIVLWAALLKSCGQQLDLTGVVSNLFAKCTQFINSANLIPRTKAKYFLERTLKINYMVQEEQFKHNQK